MKREVKERFKELEERISRVEGAIDSSAGKISTKKKQSLAEFASEKPVSTHIEKALVIGFYLEHIEDNENFVAPDIEAHYKKVKWKPPANIYDVVGQMEKKGFIMEDGETDGKTCWILTSTGEQEIQANMEES